MIFNLLSFDNKFAVKLRIRITCHDHVLLPFLAMTTTHLLQAGHKKRQSHIHWITSHILVPSLYYLYSIWDTPILPNQLSCGQGFSCLIECSTSRVSSIFLYSQTSKPVSTRAFNSSHNKHSSWYHHCTWLWFLLQCDHAVFSNDTWRSRRLTVNIDHAPYGITIYTTA